MGVMVFTEQIVSTSQPPIPMHLKSIKLLAIKLFSNREVLVRSRGGNGALRSTQVAMDFAL